MISDSRHLPPQPWAGPKQMEEYGAWLAAEAHEWLVTIHLFLDGNGRTARLVMNFILLSEGYPVVNIPGDLESRHTYYDALEACNLEGNSAGFVMLIARHALAAVTRMIQTSGGRTLETGTAGERQPVGQSAPVGTKITPVVVRFRVPCRQFNHLSSLRFLKTG